MQPLGANVNVSGQVNQVDLEYYCPICTHVFGRFPPVEGVSDEDIIACEVGVRGGQVAFCLFPPAIVGVKNLSRREECRADAVSALAIGGGRRYQFGEGHRPENSARTMILNTLLEEGEVFFVDSEFYFHILN